MHPLILLQRWLETTCPFIHQRRLQSLLLAVGALVRGQRLVLTDLGRHLPVDTAPRHAIKRVDRLLGNRHLAGERRVIYQAIAAWLLRRHQRPILLVDWSDMPRRGGRRRHMLLKAALAHRGRAITLYEEVHTLRAYNSARAHRHFLTRLAGVVPSHCHPIVITDAGFRGPWFRAVEALGWDWLGRVRDNVNCRPEGTRRWCPAIALYRQATTRARSLGRWQLSSRTPYTATLHRVRQYRRRGPGRPRGAHGHSYSARVGRKRHREPWLLATSMDGASASAAQVVALYAKRMQIEHTFRDDKGCRWGWQLDYSGSRTIRRLEALLLIGTLGTFLAWLAGLAAERERWHERLQSSAPRRRRTLSTVFIGRYLLRGARSWLNERRLLGSVLTLPETLVERSDFVGIP